MSPPPFFFVAIPSLFMKEEDGPLFMESGDWFPKWKGGGVSFARQPFFLLDSQVI